jgi:hypothetical protein
LDRLVGRVTVGDVTAKEKLHRLVDELSEQEAGSALRLIAARREGDVVDEWGNVGEQMVAASARALRQLSDEERRAGIPAWRL